MSSVEAVLLPVGTDLYALPIAGMREVIAAPAVTTLVTASPVVMGLVNLRGEIVPLLDLALLLGLGSPTQMRYVAVLNTSNGPVGLAASGLPERTLLVERTGPSVLAGTAGSFRVHDRVAVLLDLDVLLTADQLGERGTRTGSTLARAS